MESKRFIKINKIKATFLVQSRSCGLNEKASKIKQEKIMKKLILIIILFNRILIIKLIK